MCLEWEAHRVSRNSEKSIRKNPWHFQSQVDSNCLPTTERDLRVKKSIEIPERAKEVDQRDVAKGSSKVTCHSSPMNQ